jgi:hypothetical protein
VQLKHASKCLGTDFTQGRQAGLRKTLRYSRVPGSWWPEQRAGERMSRTSRVQW